MSITFAVLDNQVNAGIASEFLTWSEKHKGIRYYNFADLKDVKSISLLISSWANKSEENDYLVIFKDGHIDENDMPFKDSHVDMVIALTNANDIGFYYMIISKKVANLAPFDTIDELLQKVQENNLSVIEKETVRSEVLGTVTFKKNTQ